MGIRDYRPIPPQFSRAPKGSVAAPRREAAESPNHPRPRPLSLWERVRVRAEWLSAVSSQLNLKLIAES
jgi:hypothetical protein